jgi:protein involved in polysaccharide export with SLBB domain
MMTKVGALTALLMILLAPPAAAQTQPWDLTGAQMTRAELQQLLARYEGAAATGGGAVQEQSRLEAMLIRQRLEQGDLRVGDRILLLVEGHPTLSDTFNVVAGRKIVLQEIGDIPLEGVLRSELQQHLAQHIGRFVRSPVVRARPLVRLEILGAVGRPGYYAVPSDMLVSDALMLAGGPGGNADVERLRIHRGREVLWQGERMRAAVIEGRTLDQLSVQAGDGIFVPERTPRMNTLRDVLVVATGVTSVIWALTRIGVF